MRRDITQEVLCLRSLVSSSLANLSTTSAIFYADKLVTLSNQDPDDIYLYAKVLTQAQQYRRAVHTLKRTSPEVQNTLRFRTLTAQCLYNCRQYEQALSTLGADEDAAERYLNEVSNRSSMKTGDLKDEIRLEAVFCLCRGQICQRMESRKLAKKWYCRALEYDVHCYEAFSLLVGNHMLSEKEQYDLLTQLDFEGSISFVRPLYHALVAQTEATENKLEHTQSQLRQYGLKDNLDLMAIRANNLYQQFQYHESKQACIAIMDKDPFNEIAIPTYICSLIELKDKSALFLIAHTLVEMQPGTCISSFAVGSYYYVIQKYEIARRHFSKATALNPQFMTAWIAFGHAFSAQEEFDQAMAAYRTADRLFRGSSLPKVCIGTEYLRIKNLKAAESYLNQALEISKSDPLVFNEIGCVAFEKGEYQNAIEYFEEALRLVSGGGLDIWETTFSNLAHAYRKLRKFEKAKEYYEKAIGIAPRRACLHSGLGFTFHLMGQLDEAIECYHRALGLNSSDTFTSDVMTRALGDLFGR